MIKNVLITGSAGFIGYHLAETLLEAGYRVHGFDSISDYYDVNLKYERIKRLGQRSHFTFKKIDLSDYDALAREVENVNPDIVVHLAAQAGVRYSIEEPRAYFDANLAGTFNLLESIRRIDVSHLLMASTSSVYGSNKSMPFSECEKADTQMSFYAATKKATENLTHSYSHIYNIPITQMRFFTVYGPWGRPDMALFKFTKAILDDQPIQVFNQGNMSRDFTYVSDVVDSIRRLIDAIPERDVKVCENDSISNVAPWRVVNIGNGSEEKLMSYIEVLEKYLGKSAKKIYLPLQQGDVVSTLSDRSLLKSLTGNTPKTSIEIGVKHFVEWYMGYYNEKI